MTKKPLSTWTNYIGSPVRDERASNILQQCEISRLFSTTDLLSKYFFRGMQAAFLLDYASGRYLTMSESANSFLLHGAEGFLKGGIGHTLEIFNKDDLKVFNEQLFPERLGFISRISQNDLSRYISTYNFRLLNRHGSYVHILQRSIFLNPDHLGNPTMSCGVILNLGEYGDARPITHTIEMIDLRENVEVIHRKKYFRGDRGALFSKRETEVLLWMAEGLSCKQIADKMFVSEHTVINHKRNMLEKTGCPNSVALVTHALRTGVI